LFESFFFLVVMFVAQENHVVPVGFIIAIVVMGLGVRITANSTRQPLYTPTQNRVLNFPSSF